MCIRDRSMNCGADVYIEKPFSMKSLEASVRQLLEMRRLLRSKFSHTCLLYTSHTIRSGSSHRSVVRWRLPASAFPVHREKRWNRLRSHSRQSPDSESMPRWCMAVSDTHLHLLKASGMVTLREVSIRCPQNVLFQTFTDVKGTGVIG